MINADIVINLGIGRIAAPNSEENLEMMIGEDIGLMIVLHRALLQVIDIGIFGFIQKKKKSKKKITFF